MKKKYIIKTLNTDEYYCGILHNWGELSDCVEFEDEKLVNKTVEKLLVKYPNVKLTIITIYDKVST